MYLVKTPRFVQNIFPNFVWRVPSAEKTIFLTFDDGPIPEVTPWVLEQLAEYKAKATFFCVGENIQRFPDLLSEVKEAGHIIGNHTYNHLNGWQTDNRKYFHNVRKSAKMLGTNLFRPPYGKLKPKQAQFLQRHYHIVMWDVLSGDFDPKITKEQCLKNVIDHSKDGSIIVFHDSLKAKEKLAYVLPLVLSHFHELGYSFRSIPPEFGRQQALKFKVA